MCRKIFQNARISEIWIVDKTDRIILQKLSFDLFTKTQVFRVKTKTVAISEQNNNQISNTIQVVIGIKANHNKNLKTRIMTEFLKIEQ